MHKIRDLFCNYAGYVLFMPFAFVSHVLWAVWGLLAYGLAKLGCEATTIREPYMLVVGPMYVSTKFHKNWIYYGCEPESVTPSKLVIDQAAFAWRWSSKPTENIRGDETKAGPFKQVVIKRDE